MIRLVIRGQILDERDLGQPGPAVDRFRVGFFKQTAKDVYFTFAQPDVVLDLALPDNRLLNAANGGRAGHLRDFNRHFHAYFVIRMHTRRDAYVYAHIDVRELRVYEWVDRRCSDAHARLEAARGDWHTATHVQFGWLPVYRTDLGILNDLCFGVGQKEVRRGARQCVGIVRS